MAKPRVLVVGAGLSGLAAGFDLARGGADVRVLEAGDRAGGVVGTIERDGFRFEEGPNTVQASSEDFRRICGDLGIGKRLIATASTANERYLFHRGRLRRLPTSPLGFLFSSVLSVRARFRAGTEPFRRWSPPPEAAGEPDMAAFVTERLGREAARVLAGAFVRGVYAAELGELGARSAFPRMWKACEEHGGLVRGFLAAGRHELHGLPGPRFPRTALLSFPEGLRELVDALASALGSRLETRCAIVGLERSSSGWRARTAAGDAIQADHVVLAVPAPVAAELLSSIVAEGFPLDSLRGIAHASVTLVHLGLDDREVPSLPRGFGYLVPPRPESEDRGDWGGEPRALGSIFASNLFPGRAPEGCIAVSSFYASEDVEELDEPALVRTACEDLARALRMPREPKPRTFDVRRWKDVIPRYAPGHAERMKGITSALSEGSRGLHLAGSYVAGVSVDQVIARGRAVAAEILR